MDHLRFAGLQALGDFDRLDASTPSDGLSTLYFKNGCSLIVPNTKGSILDEIWPPSADARHPINVVLKPGQTIQVDVVAERSAPFQQEG